MVTAACRAVLVRPEAATAAVAAAATASVVTTGHRQRLPFSAGMPPGAISGGASRSRPRRERRRGEITEGSIFHVLLPSSLRTRRVAPSTAASGRRPTWVCVLKESQDLALGTRAPDFTLPEPLTGRTWSLSDFEGHPALLVAFVCNHCPYVVHIKKELVETCRHYITKEGLGVVAISANSIVTHPQDGPDAMAKLAQELDFPFPYLYDETQDVAKAYKAACTPDFYIFKKDGRRPFELFYHGQFDDSRPSNGKPVTGRDLRVALDCALSGRPPPASQRPSIGCNIKWTPGSEPDYF